ncbi:MAG: hypothetical protein QOI82_3199 [Actinomycetota bacterium]|jgi:hypothetical protein|nr:hypothetical protein [Actinomycetota bacterium]
MQRTHATNRPDPPDVQPLDRLPNPRAASGGGRLDEVRPVEDEVARLANFVLNLWALAERYEERLRRMAPEQPTFTDQQTRVATLRTAAERGRRRLVALGGSG